MSSYSTSQKKVKVGYYKYSTLTLRSALVYAGSCACVRRKYAFECPRYLAHARTNPVRSRVLRAIAAVIDSSKRPVCT